MKASPVAWAGALACCSLGASAFVVPPVAVRHSQRPARRTSPAAAAAAAATAGRRSMTLSADKKDGEEEQAPMDLDLEQMFEVFNAADKEVADEEVGKKGAKKPKSEAKDVGEMFSSFFGGGKK